MTMKRTLTQVGSYMLLLVGSALYAAEPTGVQPAKPSGDKATWTSMFDGKSLTHWKTPNFGTQGEVEVKDAAIQLGFGDGCTGITWAKDFPKSGYEIELTAMRVDGNDFFCGLTFPVVKSHCSFIVGGWGGTVVGLSNLDGQDASNNDTATFMEFKTKQWYKIRVRVIPERITTWIDDKQICDTDIRKLEIDVRPEVELSKPVGITAWKTVAAVKDIRYRELTAAEKQAALPKD